MAVNYNKMTMAQLKAELSKRNLHVTGKKSELVARLDENDKLIKEQEMKNENVESTEKVDAEGEKSANGEGEKQEDGEGPKNEDGVDSQKDAMITDKSEVEKENVEDTEEKKSETEESSVNEEKMEVTIKEECVDPVKTEVSEEVTKEAGEAPEDTNQVKVESSAEEDNDKMNATHEEENKEVKKEIGEEEEKIDDIDVEKSKETAEKISEKDAIDIIHQIDDLISADAASNADEENKDDKKEDKAEDDMKEGKAEDDKKEGKAEDDKKEGKAEDDMKEGKAEDDKKEGKAEDDKKEGNAEEAVAEEKTEVEEKASEEKPEEPKVELKTDDFDFTKSATGFVIALDNGKNVVIPVKDMLKIDMKSRRQSKTVLAYPLTIDDLRSGMLNPFIEKCCHFSISFNEYSHERQKSTKGYAEFIFATDEEAHEQADLMAEMNDNLVVRQLSRKDKPNNTYNEIPQELITVNNMLKKYIYIGNLPSTATEEELQALFPESNNLAVIVNNDGLPKGYALAELPTAEAVDEAVKKSMKINYPGYENKLLIMRPWSKIPKGILDSSSRKELLDKIRNLRKLRMKCTDDIVRNRLENDMALMKMKLDKDCKARDEIGLPVPPDIVRLEEAKAAKRESDKSKDKTGANISTIQRGNKSIRRGGMGQSGATITTAGTFGNNQGFKKPFQNHGARGGGFSGRQNYRGGNQGFRGGTAGFRGGNQGFRRGGNQNFRSGNQGFQNNQSGFQSGFQSGKQGFGVGNTGMKQGFGGGGYDSNKQGYGQGYSGSYDAGKQSYSSGYDTGKQGYGGNQYGAEPGVNNAVEMLMQVSKMLGTNQKTGASTYGVGNQSSNYTANKFGNQGGNFGNQGGSFGNQGGNFGGNFSNRGGGFSGGYKRRGDDAGYGGGGKRNTGYYNQKRW